MPLLNAHQNGSIASRSLGISDLNIMSQNSFIASDRAAACFQWDVRLGSSYPYMMYTFTDQTKAPVYSQVLRSIQSIESENLVIGTTPFGKVSFLRNIHRNSLGCILGSEEIVEFHRSAHFQSKSQNVDKRTAFRTPNFQYKAKTPKPHQARICRNL